MTSPMNRRILVLDDQESIREDFRKILCPAASGSDTGFGDAKNAFFGGEDEDASSGIEFELTTASQGEEGVALLRSAVEAGAPFALAFVDVRMPPGIDGVQAIRELWNIDPDLQVVICTAYSDYSFDEIIDSLGHSDRLLILKKPFDPVEVRQLAGALTEKWNMSRAIQAKIAELEEANVRADSANRAKSEFLANVSHEIRTPMNAMLGYLSLLCDPGATQEERERYGQTIKRSGDHLLAILNDILDVSQIEASRLVINRTDLSPFEVVHEVMRLMRPQAAEKDLEFELRVEGAIPEVIESDRVRLRQILMNLIGNAIKFTEEGFVRVVLELDPCTGAEHRYLKVSVEDSGIGVPENFESTIFDPFSQVDGSLTRRYGGTGLGLTIAGRLAVLLGGGIKVARREEGGSVFTLDLYAGQLGPVMMREYDEAECSLERGPTEEHPKELEEGPVRLEGRVLVAEDVKFNQTLIKAFLRRAGADVHVVGNGAEALESVREAEERGEPFDIVVMDMQMPVLDGYEATRRLRASGYSRPIIALTAHAMVGDREKCMEAGCDDYATKPLDQGGLVRACRRVLAHATTTAPLPGEAKDVPSSVEE
ncbi:MAG TPA: hybrid sensor histidine kinase/response regulator [Planctomycetes bacterium]|nr:hybrid sensor histidine kinase/response regulator [Planctomycetota bacterium]